MSLFGDFRAVFARELPASVDLKVQQSGFGVEFTFWSGKVLEDWPQISQRIRERIFLQIFRPCFSRVSGPRKKSPVHAQDCWHFLQIHIFESIFLYANFLLTGPGETNICPQGDLFRGVVEMVLRSQRLRSI